MEAGSRRRAEVRGTDVSPERTKVWAEPNPRLPERKVSVVYYLSRNSQLEHPHYMEVTVPSGKGLYLRDVIKRLNSLRGEGIGSSYAWSSKRCYNNGFVWHDLCENDFIYPSHGNEYILKGSEFLHLSSSNNELEEAPKSVKEDSCILLQRQNRPAWGSFDLGEYKVCKNKMTGDGPAKNADAWTQTEDGRQKSRQSRAIKEDEEAEENPVTELELGGDEISPPSSSSSSETLEGLIKADGRIIPIEKDGDVGTCSRRKTRTPAALMQLISCGSTSVKERGFSLMSHFKGRLPRATSGEGLKVSGGGGAARGASFRAVELEEKEFFSGSLVEIKRKASDRSGELSGLRRSSSCNAERGLKMELAEEIEGVKARCIPRRPKAIMARRKEADDQTATVSSSASESKGINQEPLQN